MPLFAPLLLARRTWSWMLDFLDQRDSLSSTPLVFPPTSPPLPLLPETTSHARLASTRPSTEKRRRIGSAASRLQKVSDTAPRLHGESEVPVEEVARIGIACLLPRVLSPLTRPTSLLLSTSTTITPAFCCITCLLAVRLPHQRLRREQQAPHANTHSLPPPPHGRHSAASPTPGTARRSLSCDNNRQRSLDTHPRVIHHHHDPHLCAAALLPRRPPAQHPRGISAPPMVYA